MADQGVLFEVRLPIESAESIYVISEPGSSVAKIGKATNVRDRLSGIQTSNPRPLIVRWRTPGGRPLERQLHDHFERFRLVGEWFDFGALDPVAEVRAAVKQITGHPGIDPERVLPNGDLQRKRVHPDHPDPSDPDFENPAYQRYNCGCRRLTPMECVEAGDKPDAFSLTVRGYPDEGADWCRDSH